MNGHPILQTHPEIVNRLRRAEGHLRSIIDMIERSGRASTSPNNCTRWRRPLRKLRRR